MNRLRRVLSGLVFLLGIHTAVCADLPANGGFENGLRDWKPLWTREPNTGTLTLDEHDTHGGRRAARIEHTGEKDFTLEPAASVPVTPGDRFELSAWVKQSGTGTHHTTLCVATLNAQGQVQNWLYGSAQTTRDGDWEQLQTAFIVPAGIVRIQPRIIGGGTVTLRLDDFTLRPLGNADALRDKNLPPTLTLSNSQLTVTFDTRHATLTVRDRRTDTTYQQTPLPYGLIVSSATVDADTLRATLWHSTLPQPLTVTLQLEANAPELAVVLTGDGKLPTPLLYPAPFASAPGDTLALAINEGVAYPVDDPAIAAPRYFPLFSGHSYSMAFWGQLRGHGGVLTIVETPDDAVLDLTRADNLLTLTPEWRPQRGQFGYPRQLRYIFLDQGGHVAMAKRYRVHAQQTGLLKTLAEKRARNRHVDKLIGAVNVWYWDGDAVAMAKEMRAAGIDRILWSQGTSGENVKALNDLGLLTSRYDLYQDIMNPEEFPRLQYKHGDWIPDAWPDRIVRRINGDWERGWEVEAKDGTRIACGVLCDTFAPDYARQRIGKELPKAPYRCRFIDTTTAASWRECYAPGHPMTRSQSRWWKMELLRVVSEEFQLVTGTETGHDAAVPYVHYFEGMLSLTPYRIHDAGRHMERILDDVPDEIRNFQLNPRYRLPLWELVYHDCVVAHWYWGDYTNKLPAVWDQRDLFNILYATPPLFLFKREFWQQHKDRFLQSYRNVCPLVRSVGTSEMTDHRILTPDKLVQQTAFANGTVVTVNFGSTPYLLPDNRGTIAPLGFQIEPGKESR